TTVWGEGPGGEPFRRCVFFRMAWGEPGVLDCGSLSGIILPIGVECDDGAVLVMQLDVRIGERSCDARASERRSDCADNQIFRGRALHNKSADKDIITRESNGAGGE